MKFGVGSCRSGGWLYSNYGPHFSFSDSFASFSLVIICDDKWLGEKSSALYPTLSWENFFNLLFPTFFLSISVTKIRRRHDNSPRLNWFWARSVRQFSSLFFFLMTFLRPKGSLRLCYSISILCAMLIVYETFPSAPKLFGHCRWHFHPSFSTQHSPSKSFVQFITNATSCVRKSTQVSATSAKKADYFEWSVEWRKKLVAFVIMP